MELIEFKKLFNDYYNSTYLRWRVNKEKAGKDIVGEEYESFRKGYYQENGFGFGDKQNVLGSGVNCDLCLTIDGKIVIIEEDKGSYVDGTFLSRSLMDAAKIVSICISDNLPIPYFILSSPTTMKNYNKTFNENVVLFKNEISEVLKEKYIYLPLSEESRINRKIYFNTETNHFNISDKCLNIQEEIIEKIKNENGI